MDDLIKRQQNLDYIINSVNERGFEERNVVSNDYSILLTQKEFKELVVLEIYEYYFLGDRHEFDLQLIRELVESVADHFLKPDVIVAIKTGMLETIPSAIIIGISSYIGKKIIKKKKDTDDVSYWGKIEINIRKIEAELKHHDYILADEIESIFNTSKEEIQPLLKLCGCRCYYEQKRSVWIKPGIGEQKTRDILKKHRFKTK